jgi:hypothetical protein
VPCAEGWPAGHREGHGTLERARGAEDASPRTTDERRRADDPRLLAGKAECESSEHGDGGTDRHGGVGPPAPDQEDSEDRNSDHQLGKAEDNQRRSPTKGSAEQRHQLQVSPADPPPPTHDHHQEDEASRDGQAQHRLGQCAGPGRDREAERVGDAGQRQDVGDQPQTEVEDSDDAEQEQQWNARPRRDVAAVKAQARGCEDGTERGTREEKSQAPRDRRRVLYRLGGVDERGLGISREAAR